jgi:hypothetical protein
VGSITLAATDASWKTHMSQVCSMRRLQTTILSTRLNPLQSSNQHPPPLHDSTLSNLPTNTLPLYTTQPSPIFQPTPSPALHVAHIGTWSDGSFGGDALDDNLIVDGWDRCCLHVLCV